MRFAPRHGLCCVGTLLAVHAVHAALLLWPSLVLGLIRDSAWKTGLFALGIVGAAILESGCLAEPDGAAPSRIHDRCALRVARLVGLCLLLVFWLAQAEAATRPTNGESMQLAGMGLLAWGVFLRLQAIRALGVYFVSDIRVATAPVRVGVYTWMRHPSELGLVSIAVGGPLLLGAPLSAAVAASLLGPVSWWRARRENAAWSSVEKSAGPPPARSASE